MIPLIVRAVSMTLVLLDKKFGASVSRHDSRSIEFPRVGMGVQKPDIIEKGGSGEIMINKRPMDVVRTERTMILSLLFVSSVLLSCVHLVTSREIK